MFPAWRNFGQGQHYKITHGDAFMGKAKRRPALSLRIKDPAFVIQNIKIECTRSPALRALAPRLALNVMET